jgi:hypothetical protein
MQANRPGTWAQLQESRDGKLQSVIANRRPRIYRLMFYRMSREQFPATRRRIKNRLFVKGASPSRHKGWDTILRLYSPLECAFTVL